MRSFISVLVIVMLVAAAGCDSDSGPSSPSGSAPDTPDALAVTGTGFTTLSLGWGEVENADAYLLERSDTGTREFETIYEGASNGFVDTDLFWASTYHYRVSATNAVGDSDPSDTVTGHTDVPGGFFMSGSGGDAEFIFGQFGEIGAHPFYQSYPAGLGMLFEPLGDPHDGQWVIMDMIETQTLYYHPAATPYPSATG